jgi:hypothetical protein
MGCKPYIPILSSARCVKKPFMHAFNVMSSPKRTYTYKSTGRPHHQRLLRAGPPPLPHLPLHLLREASTQNHMNSFITPLDTTSFTSHLIPIGQQARAQLHHYLRAPGGDSSTGSAAAFQQNKGIQSVHSSSHPHAQTHRRLTTRACRGSSTSR